MSTKPDFPERWRTMPDEKRAIFLQAVRGCGRLTEEQINAFPKVKALKGIMNCLVDCDDKYEAAANAGPSDTPNVEAGKMAIRMALRQHCSLCTA